MAGITQKNILYLKVTCGRLIHKKGGVITHNFGGYEGTIIGIRERENEFEGKKLLNIEVKMKDTTSDEIVIIQFNKKAWFALGFFARIKKIDFTKPFTIGVLPSEQNEKMSFCYLKQLNLNIKKDDYFPKYATIKVSGEDVQDWTYPFEEMNETIKYISEKISPFEKTSTELAELTEAKSVPSSNEDDLPF